MAPLYAFALRNMADQVTCVAVLSATLMVGNLLFIGWKVDVFGPFIYAPLHVLGIKAVLRPNILRDPPRILSPMLTPLLSPQKKLHFE